MKAAIAIDTWKLPFFERHLTDAGYSFQQQPGPTADTLLLTVETADEVTTLEPVVRAANAEAAAAQASPRH